MELNCFKCLAASKQGNVKTLVSKCSSCKRIIVTTNRLPQTTDIVNMPNNTVYYHLNEDEPNAYSLLFSESAVEDDPDLEKYREKSVLLIGSGKFGRMPVLLNLLNLPFKRIVCLCNEKTWAHTFINDWILAEHEDISQKESTIKAIDNYMRENNMYFDTIITYDDLCTTLTSYLSELYGLNGISFDFCTKIKNKYEFRKLCKQQGISHPNFFKIDSNQRRDYIDYYKRIANKNKNVLTVTNLFDAKITCNLPVVVKNPFGLGKGERDFKNMSYFSNAMNIHQDFFLQTKTNRLCSNVQFSRRVLPDR